MNKELEMKFESVFNIEKGITYFSPGRINLIGEHTDYNGGHVFPAAITIGTYGVAVKRSDDKIRVFSDNFEEIGVIEFSLDNLEYSVNDNWANYPKGVIKYLIESGYEISSGVDILFHGTIPNGAGLSSSASIELLTGVIIEDLFQLDIDRMKLVEIGKQVENKFVGVNSGIMDQFAIGMGKKNQAMLLDVGTMTYEMVPAEFGKYAVVIMNTNKRRELADSKYNERRSECEEALSLLHGERKIESLGDLDEKTFEQISKVLENPILYKRARHAVTENQRTLKAKKVLAAGDLVQFGKLLNESHESLKNDYEVTGKELDTLVYAAQRQEGVLGARMTGAGFGGCGIALVEESNIEEFIQSVGKEYQEVIGYEADFYKAHIGDGARKL